MSDALLQIRSCCQAFPKPDGEDLLVLNDINFTLAEGEIVGLLGRSANVSIPSVVALEYAGVYLVAVLAVAVYHFHRRDL